jgi:CubicO group peptidase (beta-lactamase class C family)
VSVDAAVKYAQKHALEACVVADAGKIVSELYENGFQSTASHALYSGTKSFWGPLAIRAEEDGILRLDEPAADTIHEWREDAVKRQITIRMLLSLTAGFGFGGLGNAVPPYDRAIATPLKNKPGTTFTYGGIPLQIFGALLARKLGRPPQAYLTERLLKPAGVEIASWRKLQDGTETLPTGAFLTARNWLTYGRYINDHREEFARCFEGSAANPRYGLGWWLGFANPKIPKDLIYASGSGGQGMYIIPSRNLIAVHFGKSASYKHETFVKDLVQ